jgi:hypothetical protein
MNTVYDKTEKGREEIATRKYHLAPRLRTLLVLIDGKHDADDLMKKVEGLGLGLESLRELQEQAFIAALEGSSPLTSLTPAAPAIAPPVAASQPGTAPAPVSQQVQPAPQVSAADVQPASNGSTPPATTGSAEAPVSDATRFKNVYQFYNETIKSMIGLRGYGLQLKVEKAGTLEELRAVRKPYLEAVQKAKGIEVARGMRDRLDQLLGTDPAEMGNTIFAGTSQD